MAEDTIDGPAGRSQADRGRHEPAVRCRGVPAQHGAEQAGKGAAKRVSVLLGRRFQLARVALRLPMMVSALAYSVWAVAAGLGAVQRVQGPSNRRVTIRAASRNRKRWERCSGLRRRSTSQAKKTSLAGLPVLAIKWCAASRKYQN